MIIWELNALDDQELALLALDDIDFSTDDCNILVLVGLSELSLSHELKQKFNEVFEFTSPVRSHTKRMAIVLLHIFIKLEKYMHINWMTSNSDGLWIKNSITILHETWFLCNWLYREIKSTGINPFIYNTFSEAQNNIAQLIKDDHFPNISIESFYHKNIEFYNVIYDDNWCSWSVVSGTKYLESVIEKWSSCRTYSNYKYVDQDFIAKIMHLLSRCHHSNSKKVNYISQSWPSLLAITSGWFFRISVIYKNHNQHDKSLLALTRAIENVLIAQILSYSHCEFNSVDGLLYDQDGKKIKGGAGKYIEIFTKNRLSEKIKTSKDYEEFEKKVRSILSIRNASRFAHGILNIDKASNDMLLQEGLGIIRSYINEEIADDCFFAFSKLAIPSNLASNYLSFIKKELDTVVIRHG